MIWNINKTIMCSKCQERPAVRKRLILCIRCYQNEYKGSQRRGHNLETRDIKICKSIVTQDKYEFKAEIMFAQNHSSFIYQPATFCVGSSKYSPDFYDPDANIFYEIIGTRQRFEQLKMKIEKFCQLFPNIRLEVVCADGKPYHSTKWPDERQNEASA